MCGITQANRLSYINDALAEIAKLDAAIAKAERASRGAYGGCGVSAAAREAAQALPKLRVRRTDQVEYVKRQAAAL